MTKEIKWSGYSWLTQERWGQVHPDKPNWWYDESACSVDADECLHLLTHNNPKYFVKECIDSSIGVGLVSCTEKFGYGTFEIEAKMPYGKNLWPAFWMWSFDSWPPEIDIFEGYSDNNKNFFKFVLRNPFGFWNLQTNVHFKTSEGNEMLGGKTKYFGFKDPTKNFIKYRLEWAENSIKIFYDDRLVRKVTDNKVLLQLSGAKMNVIINNGITPKYDVNRLDVSDFVIKYFKYIKA